MESQDHYQNERRWMVENTIASRGVRDERVLHAISELPRHLFVPQAEREDAYADHPAASRLRADHLAALHRGADDRAAAFIGE